MLLAKKVQDVKDRFNEDVTSFMHSRRRYFKYLETSLKTSASEIGDRANNAIKEPSTINTVLALRALLNSGSWVTHSTVRMLYGLQGTQIDDDSEKCMFREEIIESVAAKTDIADLYSPEEIFSAILQECEDEIHTPKEHKRLKISSVPYTMVLISGVFNEIFSTAAFERGAQHLQQEYGMDFIVLSVKGGKSCEHNARLIQSQLSDYVERNPDKKLWLMGFSKGGVDSLHFLSQNKEFARNHVAGLSTIASPILGTEKIDHNMIKTVNKIKNISDKTVGKVLKDTSNLFFQEVQNSLHQGNQKSWFTLSKDMLPKELFYTAVALKSEWYESHIWMMLTKFLFQSKSYNDGIVDAHNAQYPPDFGGVNLGVISGHHLIGTRSSFYCQEALLEAHIIYLQYAGIMPS